MDIQQKAIEILTQLQQGIAKYAPLALKEAIDLYHYQALVNLIQTMLVLIAGVLCFRRAKYLSEKLTDNDWKESGPSEKAIGTIIFYILSAFAGVTVFIMLLQSSLWLGLFRPDLALIRDILYKLLDLTTKK